MSGIALKFPLSGLVRCSVCLRSMTISTSNGQGGRKIYSYYHCIAARDGSCTNTKYFREDIIRKQVVDLILERLFDVKRSPNELDHEADERN